MTTGRKELFKCPKIDDGNYHVLPVDYTIDRTGSWESSEMLDQIMFLKPHLVYHIGTHLQPSLLSVLKLSKKMPETKFVTFSMRGPNWDIFYQWKKHPIKSILKYIYHYNHLKCLNKYSDAIICHYPDAVKSFKKEGYNGPIYMCTQVGVNADVYKPNIDYRFEIREKYNLKGQIKTVSNIVCEYIITSDKEFFNCLSMFSTVASMVSSYFVMYSPFSSVSQQSSLNGCIPALSPSNIT